MSITKILIYFKLSSPEKIAKKLGVKIGINCEILDNPDLVFGSEPYLIKLGDNVKITTGVRFITHDGGVNIIRNITKNPKLDIFGTITIGDNVFIGINSIIMPNVIVGNNCIIAAGSIVTKNVPNNTIVGGVPAKPIETLEKYSLKVNKKAVLTHQLSPFEKRNTLISLFGESHRN